MRFSCISVQYFTLAGAHKPKFGLFAEPFRFFSLLFSFFPFSLLSYAPYILLCTSFLLAWKVLIFVTGKPWKGDHDQVQVYWPALSPLLHQKLINLFSIRSVRMQSIFKMDSPVERSSQHVLVAYQKNLLTFELLTSEVVEWLFLQIPEKSSFSIIRVKRVSYFMTESRVCKKITAYYFVFYQMKTATLSIFLLLAFVSVSSYALPRPSQDCQNCHIDLDLCTGACPASVPCDVCTNVFNDCIEQYC